MEQSNKATSVLRAEGLRKRFGRKPVIEAMDFAPHKGCVTVLLGANGAGKSTFFRLCLGTERPQAGTLRVLGMEPIRDQAQLLRRVGYVPAVPDVYAWMKPADLFKFLAPHYPTWDDEVVDDLGDRLTVPFDTRFGQMSRGQGMKTMLVAALAPRPELLLLDEPFAGLDPLVRDEVLHGVIAALREEDCTVLCATHDLEVASRLADRVAILADGRITRHGDLDEVVEPQVSVPSGLKQALSAECDAAAASEPEEACR